MSGLSQGKAGGTAAPITQGTVDPVTQKRVQAMNRQQAQSRMQELQSFLKSGQPAFGVGFNYTTRDKAQQELAAIQQWLPQAPVGVPNSTAVEPQQYATDDVAQTLRPSIQPSVRAEIARTLD